MVDTKIIDIVKKYLAVLADEHRTGFEPACT
jgi:hypothetical protein